MWWNVAFVLLFCGQLSASKNVEPTKSAGGFLLLIPKTLTSGNNETVCISIHNNKKVPVKFVIDFKWKDKHYTTHKTLESPSSCFDLHVPLKKISDPQFISVRVQVLIDGETFTAHNQDPILLYPSRSNRVFIETDRGVYKPGDTLKFIVLRLNELLLPVSQNVSEIKIKNPMGVTAMAWDNVRLDRGLVSLEYQLVAEAMTGKWKLLAENQVKEFEVAKYNLPRFRVEINYPKLVYYQTDSVQVVVCGRYSYNKPVAGIAFVQISDPLNNMSPVNKLFETTSNGCAEFRFSQTELQLDVLNNKNHETKIYLHITATITEYGTNKIDVATGRIKIVFKGYNLKFLNNPGYFIPGMPYEGKLKLTNVLANSQQDLVEICHNLAIKKSWNYVNDEQCRNFTVPHDGVIRFKLWPFKSQVLHVHLHAKSLNNSLVTDKAMLVRLYSPSSSYVVLENQKVEGPACNRSYYYKVLYTTDHFNNGENVTFYYTIRSTNKILQMDQYVHTVQKTVSDLLEDKTSYIGEIHKFNKFGTSTDEFLLKFTLAGKRFATDSQLLVYYIATNGETVASTARLNDDIKPCTLQVNALWTAPKLLPGARATINIETGSEALCALSSLDRAAKFVSANQHQANLERIFKTFVPERESAKSGRNSCIAPSKKSSDRAKRHVYSFSEDYDAYDVFTKFGIATITNLQIVSKPCYNGPLVNDSYEVQFLTDHYETADEDASPISIRSFFPETWLWELIPVKSNVELHRDMPHSITNWATNVFCVSELEGIGFAQETEIGSFQAFFADVLTPYSVKKGESFHLMVHVSNYVNYTFPVKVSVRLSENLRLTQQLSGLYCLKENSTITHNYPVTAVESGVANVTVLVESESQYPLPCGPETIVSKRDAVFKSFLVESEGLYVASTESTLLCAGVESKFATNVTWTLAAPQDVVPETGKLTLTINTDLMGPTIQNLHHLLTIPTGCGEQIMASMAPNIYVLRYLGATRALTSSIRQTITRNLKMGYQRILNYLHPDGSFSAFGYYDPSGSMFLTTFVIKVLQEARHVIYVDQRVVDRAVDWVLRHQLENGCFETMHHVFQDMGGTNVENSTAGLTAYVILSLFDAKANVPDSVQTNAKYCIRSQQNPDKYSLVISSYALFKVHWISEAERLLDRAIAVSNVEDGKMWWSTRPDAETFASDIEITGYALLAMMESKSAKSMAHAHAIVQWLTSKMGPTGGYKSTQDTTVALEALTKYAKLINERAVDLNMLLESPTRNRSFSIDSRHKFGSEEITLEKEYGKFGFYVSGAGCVLAQLTHSYYTTNTLESEAFSLAVEISPVSNVDKCSIKSISPCLAYDGPDKLSNMAVMEIDLPSGFQADRASLYELLRSGTDKNIKMFEEKDNTINIYFTNLGKDQVCFHFNINENTPVEGRKRNYIKLYNYYRPELNVLQFYRILNNCSRSLFDESEKKVVMETKVEAQILLGSNVVFGEEYLENNTSSLLCRNPTRNITRIDDLFLYKQDIHQNYKPSDQITNIPKCVYLPLLKDRSKRNTNTAKHKNLYGLINEPQASTCIAIPFYVPYNDTAPKRSAREVIWVRYKRDLNKDFVDTDVDMETPNCVNIPFYVSPQTTITAVANHSSSFMARQAGNGPHPLQPGG